MLKSFYPLVFSSLICLVTACKDEVTCDEVGTIRDFQGQNNCSLVIEIGSGEFLEPINAQDFGILLIDGQKIRFSYVVSVLQPTCLVSTPIEITCYNEEN